MSTWGNMQQGGGHEATNDGSSRQSSESRRSRDWRDKFGIPEPVKRVFGKFPLVTYGENELPITSPRQRHEHTLWLWTTPEGALKGHSSFNPTCLKWQAYLKFRGIPFRIQSSNNHASPSGSLPFVTPAVISLQSTIVSNPPIPSSKLRTWAVEQNSAAKDADLPLRADAYTALIDLAIRRAWLYTLYLEPVNFASVAQRLYVDPWSTNPLVNAAIAYQLRKAAQDELLKTRLHVEAEELMEEANDAFAALAVLLGEDEWFFGEKEAGLFDAQVFAYSHLLLDQEMMGWQRNELGDGLRGHGNLVRHRERIVSRYFS